MTLKFSWNAKLTRSLTGWRPVRPAADDYFGQNVKETRALTGLRPVPSAADDNFEI